MKKLIRQILTVEERNKQRYNQVRSALDNLNKAVRKKDATVIRLYSEEATNVLNSNKPEDYEVKV